MSQFYLYASIIFNVLTNVGFKISALNEGVPTKKWSFFSGALVFGLINSYLFTECLKDISLQVASAIFFSLTIVGLFLASHFMFKEAITTWKLVGGAFIIIGVVIMSLK